MAYANGDIISLAVKWRITGIGDAVNVWTVRLEAITGSLSDIDFADGVLAWLDDLYVSSGLRALMANNNVHYDVLPFNLTANAPGLPLGAYPGLNGGATGNMTPVGVAALLLLRTPVSRRVGRKYFPPMSSGSLDDNGEWGTDVTGAMTAMGAYIVGNYDTTLGFEIRVVVGHADMLTYSDVTSVVPKRVPAYQRRRKPGVGS